MNKRTIFLDRDGIINRVIYRNGKPSSPRNIEEWEFELEILNFTKVLKENNFQIFVVTNQPDIKRGLLDTGINQHFRNLVFDYLNINDYVYCPHDNEDNCNCRKPKPGMMHMLEKKWNINRKESFMIGDTNKDIEAGKKYGCTTILLKKEYNVGTDADYRFTSLNQVLKMLKI